MLTSAGRRAIAPRLRAVFAVTSMVTTVALLAGCGGSDDSGGGGSASSGSSSAPAAAGEPAGAANTKVTDWADPRPSSWGQEFTPFGPTESGDGSLARVQKEGLNVCANNQVVPFTYLDPKSGKLVGFEVDMLAWMAQHLGIKQVKYTNIEWQALIPALSANKCDMAMAGIAIRANRENAPGVKFTVPYFLLFDQVTVRRDSTITSLAQLEGKKVASVVGSTDADNLDIFLKSEGMKANVVKFNGYNECFQAVVNKLADACWLDQGTTLGALEQFKVLKTVGDPFLFQPKGPFATEGKLSPYVFGSVGMVTREKDNDLNRALSIADVEMIKSGVQRQMLEKTRLWSDKQVELVRSDSGWTGPLATKSGA
jgi:polar amino acid transport system substrate-binding protein